MPSQAWFDSKTAFTAKALAAGNGCHFDEAKALSNYLHGLTTPQEAATQITTAILAEYDPPKELYRIWALLTEALVELPAAERHTTLDLLSAMQALPPPTSGLTWSKLPGFASMWDTMYRLHLHGADRWEEEMETFSEEKRPSFRRDYDAIGSAEAEMFLRRFDGVVSENWGYKVFNLVCCRRRRVDIFLGEMYAWLRIAGAELKGKVDWSQPGVTFVEWRVGGNTTSAHWETWKEALLEYSKASSRLTEEGRGLAAQCYELM